MSEPLPAPNETTQPSTNSAAPIAPMPTSYSSLEGRAHVARILAAARPSIIPHDYQLDGICKLLDGNDVVATMATLEGKTGFHLFFMIVAREIGDNASLALPGRSFPKNPCMLLLIPTKALQSDMSKSMEKFGVKTCIINRDTLVAASAPGDSQSTVWEAAVSKSTVVMIGPEQLQTDDFEKKLMRSSTFKMRTILVGVDEIHLLHWWGQSFRPSFQDIAFIRSRIGEKGGKRVSLLGTTATLHIGDVKAAVFNTLGIRTGALHHVHRSNMRHDIQIICREMKSAINGISFPELDWILFDGHNTVIFCKHVALGFRVACYLTNKAQSIGYENIDKHIRMYNSLNWPSYNDESLALLNNNEQSTITITTDVLSVGWDSQFTRDAVLIGEIDNIDELVQKIGRVGRNRSEVKNPRAFWYYNRNAISTAKEVVAAAAKDRTFRMGAPTGAKPKQDALDISLASLLLAPCKPANIDLQYNNPSKNTPCTCPRCKNSPPPEKPAVCNCSGCMPEKNAPTTSRMPTVSTKPRARRGEGITDDMRKIGEAEYRKVRLQIMRTLTLSQSWYVAPEMVLSSTTIKLLIDKTYLMKTLQETNTLIATLDLDGIGKAVLSENSSSIFSCAERLQGVFAELRAKAAAKRADTKLSKAVAAEMALKIKLEEIEEAVIKHE